MLLRPVEVPRSLPETARPGVYHQESFFRTLSNLPSSLFGSMHESKIKYAGSQEPELYRPHAEIHKTEASVGTLR